MRSGSTSRSAAACSAPPVGVVGVAQQPVLDPGPAQRRRAPCLARRRPPPAKIAPQSGQGAPRARLHARIRVLPRRRGRRHQRPRDHVRGRRHVDAARSTWASSRSSVALCGYFLNPRSQGRPHPRRLPHHRLRGPRDVVVAGQGRLLGRRLAPAARSRGRLKTCARPPTWQATSTTCSGGSGPRRSRGRRCARPRCFGGTSSCANTIQAPGDREVGALGLLDAVHEHLERPADIPSGTRTRDPFMHAKLAQRTRLRAWPTPIPSAPATRSRAARLSTASTAWSTR